MLCSIEKQVENEYILYIWMCPNVVGQSIYIKIVDKQNDIDAIFDSSCWLVYDHDDDDDKI